MSDWMDAEAHADRALEMYERGRWAEAEAELRKALSLNPDQAEWHFNLGLTLEAAGRDSDALDSYQCAIELMPDESEPFVAAGVVANRLGQFDRAVKWLEQAIRLDPALEAAYAHKIDSHIHLANHEDAETTFYLAQHALAEPSAQCLAMMAESLIQRSLYSRAEWCLKEALRLEPNMPRLRARLAAVSVATGKPQRALQLYLRELRDDPGNIDTLLEYGRLLMDISRLPEAGEKFRRVLELEPANVDAHYELGQIALATHRFEQATLEFELVLKLDGQFPGIRRAMAEALLRRGRIKDARVHLLEEYELIKSAAAGDEGADNTSESVATESQQTTSSNSNQSRAAGELVQLADLMLEVDEASRAAALINVAICLDGESADRLRKLALARFRSGDRKGGVTASRRVLRKDPTCIRSIHNLTLAALEQNQLRLAAGWVKRGMLINRHDDGMRRLRIRVWLAMLRGIWTKVAGCAMAAIGPRLARMIGGIEAADPPKR